MVLRKRLARGQALAFFAKPRRPTGPEPAAARHWARELRALGHEVPLMPLQYVMPYFDFAVRLWRLAKTSGTGRRIALTCGHRRRETLCARPLDR